MREYQRATRECSVADLDPDLVEAIRGYAGRHELGDIESQALICCVTTSERRKNGLLGRLFGGPDTTQRTAMLLTPRMLIWGTTGGRRGAAVVSARLADIEVKDYDSALVEDSGLDVFGFMTGSTEKAQAFIGLGEGQAAERFRRMVKESVARSRA